MNIKLDSLNINKEIEFSYDVFKDEKLDKRIIDLKNSKVEGRIYLNSILETVLECVFKGTMIINDSITLEEIPYDFKINIKENLEEIKENYPNCYEISKNSLDLREVLWQNIVLEVPISYTLNGNKEIKGNGWELIHDEKISDEIDPRLKKLEDLLER